VSDAPAARWIARAWALLAVSSALYFLADNEADNDLWVHLFSGERIVHLGALPRVDDLSYTAAGAPWLDHEWLTQTAFATVYDSLGSTGLWLCKLVVALLTAWLVWIPVARRSQSPWVRGPVMVLVLAALARGYAIRPQIVTYLGIAALLAGLDGLDGARPHPAASTLVALIGVGFALWANAHGGFIVGIGILTLFALAPGSALPPAAAAANGARWPLSPRLRLAMLAAALAAACLNPYGASLFTYLLAEVRSPHPLTEWQPVAFGDPAHLPFLVLLAALLASLPFARTLRRRPWWAALVGLTALAALRQQRHIPLFALCAAAPLAEQADGALTALQARTQLRLSAASTVAIAVGLAALAVVQVGLLTERLWPARARIVFAAEEYPVGALRFVREHGLRGNLAVPLDWGGYALWHAAPAVKVSLDGRFATVYPPAVVDDNFAFYRGDGARLLEAYDTTLVLVPHGVRTPLDGRPGWRLLYVDAVAGLFGRDGPPAGGSSDAPRGWLPFP
jgi:hypothetical protein